MTQRTGPLLGYHLKPGVALKRSIVTKLLVHYWTNSIGSFDYSLAFDHINPYVVTSLFRHIGMPPQISKMIFQIWGSQPRWLQLYDAISATPASVTTSVPQGDAWAMLAMAVVLTTPWLDLKRKFPETTFALYVDDRTWCSPSAVECSCQLLEGMERRSWIKRE